MNEYKAMVWFFGLVLAALVLFSGEPDIVDAIRQSIAPPACVEVK